MPKPKSLPYEAPEEAGPWSVALRYVGGGSDKVYQVFVVPEGEGFVVNYANGRYGGTLATGTKTKAPVGYAEARRSANAVLFEKVGSGYLPTAGTRFADGMTEEAIAVVAKEASGHVPQLLNPVDPDDLEALIEDDDYVAEIKHDGDRRFLAVQRGVASAGNRKGQTVSILPSLAAAMTGLGRDVVLDGEQVGSELRYWDILSIDGTNLRELPLRRRLGILDELGFAVEGRIVRSVPVHGAEAKRRLVATALATGEEGVVFKHLDSRYVPGRPASGGLWQKHKFWNTLSAVVGKVSDTRRSVALVLGDDVRAVPVGNVTVPPNRALPTEGAVVEVRYLYGYRGGSLIQPTYLGERSDVDADECVLSQVVYKGAPDPSDAVADEPSGPFAP